jgi:oxygen-dependent protoporphyrinogen oxidase
VPADLRAIAKTPLVSPLGKARMALDLVLPVPGGDDDESIAAFVRRRLGREAFERMAEPLLSGIYGGNAEQLSLLATFPRLRDIERTHGGVIRGAIEQKRAATAAAANAPANPNTPKRTPFVSLRNGLQTLIDTLEQQIGDEHIHRNEPVLHIERTPDGWQVETAQRSLTADGVLLAIPAFAAAALLQPIDPALAAPLRGIPYGSSATVSLAFDAASVAAHAQGRGFVIPRREGRTLTAVTWTSRKFGGRTAPDTALLRGFVGRVGDESALALGDDDLVALVRRELRDLLGITAEPQVAGVFRWERGMPQPNLGHLPKLAAIDARIALLPGLRLTGAAYRGVGIPDVIQDARTQANQLADTLLSASASQHM